MNIALITGVTGQDGSYLSEFLLAKGYEVHGIIRRSSVDYRERIAHLEGKPNFHLHYADMGDSMSLVKLVGKVQPTEIYNLAAQSPVQVSFDAPEFTADVDAVGHAHHRLDFPGKTAGGDVVDAAHHLAALDAAGGLDNHIVPVPDGQVPGVKVVGPAAFLEFD